jgi:hypothetical protein
VFYVLRLNVAILEKTSQDVSDVIVISVVSGKGKVTVVLSFLILM